MLLLIIFIILKGFCCCFSWAYRSEACSFIHGAVFWIFQQFVHAESSHFSWCRHVEQLKSINCVQIPRHPRELLNFYRFSAAGCFVSCFKSLDSSSWANFSRWNWSHESLKSASIRGRPIKSRAIVEIFKSIHHIDSSLISATIGFIVFAWLPKLLHCKLAPWSISPRANRISLGARIFSICNCGDVVRTALQKSTEMLASSQGEVSSHTEKEFSKKVMRSLRWCS